LDQRSRILPLLTLSVGAIPWLVYDLWLTRTHPVMSTWTAQNQTPSPPLINYLFGYGLVLVLAVVGMFQADLRRDSYGRLLLAWVISNAILLYAPFSLQRRLTLGLFFPLAALAALGLMRLNEKYGRYRVILIGVLILSLPSNLIVVGAGLAGVGQQEAAVVFVQGEREAYKWLSSHAPPGALVLAAPETGNRLPAFADVRVIYGHPFETPYAETQEDRIGELYGWVGSIDEALGALTDLGVDFVFYGKRERALGEPTWLSSLTSIYRSDRFEIFEVGGP
jgi:hypothetical protein